MFTDDACCMAATGENEMCHARSCFRIKAPSPLPLIKGTVAEPHKQLLACMSPHLSDCLRVFRPKQMSSICSGSVLRFLYAGVIACRFTRFTPARTGGEHAHGPHHSVGCFPEVPLSLAPHGGRTRHCTHSRLCIPTRIFFSTSPMDMNHLKLLPGSTSTSRAHLYV